MEFLKVLVVFCVVFHGSFSNPNSSEDDVRVVIERVQGLIERWHEAGRDTIVSPLPDTRPPTEPQLSVPRVPHKWTSLKYKMHHTMLENLLKTYFGSFPEGPYTTEIPLTPHKIVTMLNAWFNNTNQMFTERTVFNVTKELLGAYFQCATTKINQMVFYVLNDQARAMTEDDQNMYTSVRTILESWIPHSSILDNVSRRIAVTAHRQIYGTFMKHVTHFQLKDLMKFLGQMKMFLRRAGRKQWSLGTFDDELNKRLQDNDINLKCPSLGTLWEFHREIAASFQSRFKDMKPVSEIEAWLRKVLPTYIATYTTPAITAILQVYTDYVREAKRNFEKVEIHMTTGNRADIINFVSMFLTPDQLEYLESIIEYLETPNTRGEKMHLD
ncbi:uncharacterized protein LOC125659406 [Ostrea edulis]|uniref:uncharacterized protein LOC125659406 n=1 Tax=Ostrea edulis TaxID=37623 RepID=UPI0024AED3DF|nr:uncharacterized protein LOC125659406 [Ostrea edulis]